MRAVDRYRRAIARADRRTAVEVWQAHLAAEFDAHDPDRTLATMGRSPYLLHLPSLEGAEGRKSVRSFYARRFLPSLPRDTKIVPISRTTDGRRVIDEFILEFTHDREVAFMAPGVAPTGRRVRLPHVAVVGIRHGRVHHEHIYWDQASLYRQLGCLEKGTGPIVGAEAAVRLRELTRRHPLA